LFDRLCRAETRADAQVFGPARSPFPGCSGEGPQEGKGSASTDHGDGRRACSELQVSARRLSVRSELTLRYDPRRSLFEQFAGQNPGLSSSILVRMRVNESRFRQLNPDTWPGIWRISLVIKHQAESRHGRPSARLWLSTAWPTLGHHARPRNRHAIWHVADGQFGRNIPTDPVRGQSGIQETSSPVAAGDIAFRRRGQRRPRRYSLATVALGFTKQYNVASYITPGAAQSFR